MKKKTYLILITAITALGGLLFGYDTGVINGAQYYLSEHFQLDSFTKGWVVGSALLGCLIGALSAGPISSKFGRKKSLIFSAILFTISAYGSGLPEWIPQEVSWLVLFRIIGGLGIGMASMNAPMYIAEIAPAKKRGYLVTYYQLAIVVGFFVVFLATYYIGQYNSEIENIESGWRQMFWSELIPSIAFLLLLFIVPKSPRWLVMSGGINEAKEVLLKTHDELDASIELRSIKESVDVEGENSKVNIFAKAALIIIIIGAVFSALQQFTGINAVLYYGADIFENALGYGKEDVLQQQVILAFVNLVFTFIAMFTIDRFGRKPLLYIGSIGMIAGFLMLGLSLMNESLGIISLLGVLLFVGSFALSMGPVVWVILSEMFPNKLRSVGMSIAVAAQWGANYFVSQTFPMVVESEVNNNEFWNGALPYFIFIGFMIFTMFFTFRWIPETKGKTLEELERIWDK